MSSSNGRIAFDAANFRNVPQSLDYICAQYGEIKFKTEPQDRAPRALALITSREFGVTDMNHPQGAADIGLALMEATPMADRAAVRTALLKRPHASRLDNIYPRAGAYYRKGYDDLLQIAQDPHRASWQAAWQSLKPTFGSLRTEDAHLRAGVDCALELIAVNATQHPALAKIGEAAPWSELDVRMTLAEKLHAGVSPEIFTRFTNRHVFGSQAYRTVNTESPIVAARYELYALTKLGYAGGARRDPVPAAELSALPR